ncbi:hypothetical protein F4778DRAFT_717897 [Xylariomycetidae sp. FL2044]|nr:hypothetical protein F4778DRAFT_717897 [Xylariomycetidae sp. FL2044]
MGNTIAQHRYDPTVTTAPMETGVLKTAREVLWVPDQNFLRIGLWGGKHNHIFKRIRAFELPDDEKERLRQLNESNRGPRPDDPSCIAYVVQPMVQWVVAPGGEITQELVLGETSYTSCPVIWHRILQDFFGIDPEVFNRLWRKRSWQNVEKKEVVETRYRCDVYEGKFRMQLWQDCDHETIDQEHCDLCTPSWEFHAKRNEKKEKKKEKNAGQEPWIIKMVKGPPECEKDDAAEGGKININRDDRTTRAGGPHTEAGISSTGTGTSPTEAGISPTEAGSSPREAGIPYTAESRGETEGVLPEEEESNRDSWEIVYTKNGTGLMPLFDI